MLPQYRHKGLGDLTLRLLLYKAQSHYAGEVRLYCADDVKGFFERLGLRTAGRQKDLNEMRIAGSEIRLDSCASCPKTDCERRTGK